MILGLVIALGTTKLVAVSIGITILSAIFLYPKRVVVPLPLWILIACIAVGMLFAPQPGNILYMVCAILSVYIAYRTLPANRTTLYILIVMSLVQVLMIVGGHLSGTNRPSGLFPNASIAGLAGIFGFPILSIAMVSGVSLSRTALLGGLLFALMNYRSKAYLLAGILLVITSLSFGMLFTPDRYFSKSRIEHDTELRINTITGTSTEHIPLDIPRREIEWRWYGYGFSNFVHQTGQIQPHNIFVRVWYELGILSIVFFSALIWLWWIWGRDWRLLIVAVTVGLFTDELLGSVYGVHMLLGYAILRRLAIGQNATMRGW